MPHLSLPCLSGILLVSVSLGSLSAHAQTSAPAENANDVKAVATDLSQETVVATVGETDITLGEVVAFRQTLPEQFQQLPDEVLLESILTQMIDQTLLENAARESGLDERSAYRLALRNQRRAVMADAFMSATVLDSVTDEAIARAYQTQFVDAPAVPEVRSAHILVEDKAQAAELKEQLDAGADFATLAAKHSTDPTAPRGGDRGWLPFHRMVPDYAEAVQGMVVGELAGPVQTPFGWHLIRVDGKRDRPVPPRQMVEGTLVHQLSQQIETETLEALRNAVTIERSPVALPAAAVRADALLQD